MKFFCYFVLIVLVACAPKSSDEVAKTPGQQGQQNEKQETGCPISFPKIKLCGQLSWEFTPSLSRYNQFHFKVWKQETPSVADDLNLNLSIELWMPSMGHGSRPVVIAKRSRGEFDISKVFFTMGGDWDIQIHFTNDQEQVVDEAKVSLQL